MEKRTEAQIIADLIKMRAEYNKKDKSEQHEYTYLANEAIEVAAERRDYNLIECGEDYLVIFYVTPYGITLEDPDQEFQLVFNDVETFEEICAFFEAVNEDNWIGDYIKGLKRIDVAAIKF